VSPSPSREPEGRTILLARHGEATWTGKRYAGLTDTPLTGAGRAGAATLAGVIAASGLLADPASVIVSSPLVRALDTARAVAQAVGRPVVVDSRWHEVSFGLLEGRTFDEAEARWPDVVDRMRKGDIAIDWPEGETWTSLRSRIAAAWDEVVARDVPVLVVSHGVAIRAALTLAAKAGPAGSRSLPLVTPAGAVAVRVRDGAWEIEPVWPAEDSE
jgi:broad specificity phosphatase PhoE